MQHKICFYIRVSTEEQAKNLEGSIKNQTDRLYEAVKFKNSCNDFGEVVSVFIDRAKSGKNTKRPELQKMLYEIQQGNIDLVMVSEISRISRNMKDFSGIWEMMKKNSCGFYSLRENFDTTTAAGEMVLYTIANIAQFERRQVSERVAANIKARAKRGLYNGGSIPVGYKTHPTKKGYLEIDNQMNLVVLRAFSTFLHSESLSEAARKLNENGVRLRKSKQGGGKYQRIGHFTVDNLYKMLTNKIYIGIKVYKDGDKKAEAKAVWKPIVPRDAFDRTQKKLKDNFRKKKPHSKSRYPYMLSGLTYCMSCGDVMCGKSAHGNGGKIGYYEHSWATKRESTLTKKSFKCSPHRVLAKNLEPIVTSEVEKLLFSEGALNDLFEKIKSLDKDSSSHHEINSYKAKLYGVNSQIDALAERLSELPQGLSAAPIYKQMKILELRRSELEERIEVLLLDSTQVDYKASLEDYEAFLESLKDIWHTASSEMKSKIIKRLIHKVEVGENSVVVHFNVDKRNLGPKTKKPSKNEGFLNSNFLHHNGSNSLTNGAP